VVRIFSRHIAATRWVKCFCTCLSGIRVFLHVLVPCCDVNYDVNKPNVRFVFTPICIVWIRVLFMFVCIYLLKLVFNAIHLFTIFQQERQSFICDHSQFRLSCLGPLDCKYFGFERTWHIYVCIPINQR
jgi:hypothetical protein